MGDLCPGDHYFSLGHGTGSRLARGANPFVEIESFLRQADISIANLEGPLSATSCSSNGPEAAVFRGPPVTAALLRRAGINLVHIANNHILQHGPGAFRTTIELLEAEGISPVGLFESHNSRPVIKMIRGLRVGLLGFSFVAEKYFPGHTLYAELSLPEALRAITQLRSDVDVVVSSVHWGVEGTAVPDRRTVAAAHAMVDAGATVVLGHHPHWFQPVERVGRALIAYSLGDFVFDLFWDRRLVESAILSVDVDSSGVVDHRLYPIRFDSDYRVRLQEQSRARSFLDDVSRREHLLTMPRPDSPRADKSEALRKLAYFLSVYHRGHTSLKTRFLLRKFSGSVRVRRGKSQ